MIARSDHVFAGCYEFGPFCLDLRRHQLFRGDDLVPLTPKAFDLLHVLVSHADRAVAKDELMRRVWPDTFVGEDSLTQHVAVLRKVLGDASDNPKYIATVHKHGYRFVAPLRDPAWGPALFASRASDQGPAPAPIQPAAPFARKAGWTVVTAVAVSAVVNVALFAAAAAFGLLRSRALPPPPALMGLMRFAVAAPDNTTLTSAGFPSPDGRHLAFIVERSGRPQLWVRSVESVDAHPLPGTDDVTAPFWSPDGGAVGFFANGKLKVVNLAGGPPQTLAALSRSTNPAGGAWSADGLVLYAEGRSGLKAVAVSGGAPRTVTTLDPAAQETQHQWPQFLPGGRFLYGVRSANPDRNGIYVGSLESPRIVRVLASVSRATYVAGRLIYVDDRALVARPFDIGTLKVGAQRDTIASEISAAGFAPPSDGLLTYLPGNGQGRAVWFDRAGAPLGTLDTPAEVFAVALSPDERQVAASDAVSPTAGIWLFDLRRHARGRLTTIGSSPVWSRDGSRVIFSSSKATGVLDLYQKPSFGDESEELLLKSGHATWPHDWSPDGRFIVYTSANPKTQFDLWLLSTADRTSVPYLQTASNELHGQVSPDGRWLAYTSDESGRWEVYVQSFPKAGHRRTISSDGGAQPRWRRDGRELFYLAADRRLMSVAIEPERGAQGSFEAGAPKALFQTRVRGPLVPSWEEYAVAANGQRFLICETERIEASMTVVVNWTEGLKPRAASR